MKEISLEKIDGVDDIKILIEIASKSYDNEMLLKLSQHPIMGVRRAVARNIHTPSHIIDALANDVTANVCFKALQHKRCTIKREEFLQNSLNRRCVACDVEELETFEKCAKCG